MPSIDDFIVSRRATIGAALVEGVSCSLYMTYLYLVLTRHCTAMLEYSLDLDIPDYVFEDPIVKAMSDATTDIMTWPNVSYIHSIKM